MKPIFHRTFLRFVQKISSTDLKNVIQKEVDKILAEPLSGKLLDHPFRKYKIRSQKFFWKDQQLRLAYTVEGNEILFLVINSRENFYKKLKKIL
jgi:hypothetical protein